MERQTEKNRWEYNTTELIGLKLGEALRQAEKREESRKVIAQSSLLPQQSFKVRDKGSKVK